MRLKLVREGAITLAVGLVFSAVGIEGLAAFNACLADAACLTYSSTPNLPAFFGLLIAGIALTVGGMTILLTGRVLGPPAVGDGAPG